MPQSHDRENVGRIDAAAIVLREMIAVFHGQKSLAERAINQLPDQALHQALDPNTNSIAIIMKHLAGNMISRWTDFLTSDGEKPDRHRDGEFIDDFTSRAQLMEFWERGWKTLFQTLDALRPDDLAAIVRIRGEKHTVARAVLRQIDHYGYHVGQIVQIARILAKDNWTTLSIPRGKSEEFNRTHWKHDG